MEQARDRKLRTILKFAGLKVGGDLGPLTIYTTRRGRRVIYPVSPPVAPASAEQRRQRSRFALAVQRSLALSDVDRSEWERVVNQLNLRATGQNLFVSLSLVPQLAGWPALVRITGTYLNHPEPIGL